VFRLRLAIFFDLLVRRLFVRMGCSLGLRLGVGGFLLVARILGDGLL
jgi:hypothetical protein